MASQDPENVALDAGLHYGSDADPGITRSGTRRFTYRWPNRALLKDPAYLERISELAVPPAWNEVWIAKDPRSHLQATGIDQRGRKQYRYHPEWTQAASEAKFEQLSTFVEALPDLRSEMQAELRKRTWSMHRLAALGVHLLDLTAMRVGNDEYAEENGTHGLTTLEPMHDSSSQRVVRFVYPAKGGQDREVQAADRRGARLVKECRNYSGATLLSVADPDGCALRLTAPKVNDVLQDYDATAKTFRTWTGTVAAFACLAAIGNGAEPTASSPELSAIDAAATRLGNTRSVARASYIHPAVLELSPAEAARLVPKRSAVWARNTFEIGVSQLLS